jgi:hypothetical protein
MSSGDGLTLDLLDGRYAVCRLDPAAPAPASVWNDPIAEAGISILALATYATDYLLVRESDLEHAIEALQAAGHTVRGS